MKGSQAERVYAALEEIGGDRMFRYEELRQRSGANNSIARSVLHQLIQYEAVRVRPGEHEQLNWYWYADKSKVRKRLLTRRWVKGILDG